MAQDEDDFEGIDINGPWGGIRIGSGGVRMGRGFNDGDDDYRRARRRVRERLHFYRNVVYYVAIVGILAVVNWRTAGVWWVQWVAAIWGGLLVLQLLSTFVAPAVWGREAEERMVRNEMQRRRGRVHVEPPPDPRE